MSIPVLDQLNCYLSLLTELTSWAARNVVDGVVIKVATAERGILCVGKDGHFVDIAVVGDGGRKKGLLRWLRKEDTIMVVLIDTRSRISAKVDVSIPICGVY